MTDMLPPPPWDLQGEAIVAVTRTPRAERARLPKGARPLPGPALVLGISYADSPVGPYLETVVCLPAAYLGRPGYSVTTITVSSEPALWAGLDFWGYPKLLGTLEWRSEGAVREIRWKERDFALRAELSGRSVPATVPIYTVQSVPSSPQTGRAGAFTGIRISGRLAAARVEIEAPAGDPLGDLAGRHRGTVAAGMRMHVPLPALRGPVDPRVEAAVRGDDLLPAERPPEITDRLS